MDYDMDGLEDLGPRVTVREVRSYLSTPSFFKVVHI